LTITINSSPLPCLQGGPVYFIRSTSVCNYVFYVLSTPVSEVGLLQDA